MPEIGERPARGERVHLARTATVLALPLFLACGSAAASEEEIQTLYVTGQRIATTTPASTYATPVSLLELDPRIDLQVRNMAEAQGDVTLRGGIFESTGFRIGGLTLFDPQTGHYAAEIPVAPEMLTRPGIETGTENALFGFNSTVGTVAFDWAPIRSRGSLTVGFGNHDARHQRIHAAHVSERDAGSGSSWGIEGELSRSESDGTMRFGDHDFSRRSLRAQLLGTRSRTELFAGDQEKFFGWFGMYTGAAFAAFDPFETERLDTRLVLLNHRHEYGADNEWQLGAYRRRHEDHYIFNRFAPNRAFVHETRVTALALDGSHRIGARISLRYSAQMLADAIDSTTLENSFTKRRYRKVALMPTVRWPDIRGGDLVGRFGVGWLDTSEERSEFLPALALAWVATADGGEERIYVEWSEAAQVPGYTAVGGSPTGLFASSPDLGIERSRNLELGVVITRSEWSAQGALFRRRDRDLVDWTYSDAAPNARTANAVDVDVSGVELLLSRQWGEIELLASAAWLDKEEDYGSALVDGSFYALNYARRRGTVALIWYPSAWLDVRLDNEWREQQPNAIRAGSDRALFTHLLIDLSLPRYEGVQLRFAGENIWNDRFQEVPGTPGRGRQLTAGLSYSW